MYHTATNYVIGRREVLRHNVMAVKSLPSQATTFFPSYMYSHSQLPPLNYNTCILPVTLARLRDLDTGVQRAAPFCCSRPLCNPRCWTRVVVPAGLDFCL